jgi:hypothetical protein
LIGAIMATENLQVPVMVRRRPGRKVLWLCWGLLILGLVIYGVQSFGLNHFVVPWYAVILASVAAGGMLIATIQHWTVLRLIGLAICLLVAGFEWYFLLFLSVTPAYTGLTPGQKVPPFTAIRADGSAFNEKQLTEQPTVLLFFRGHW